MKRILIAFFVFAVLAQGVKVEAASHNFVEFELKSESGLPLSTTGTFYATATLYRLDANGMRMGYVASSDCWGETPWDDGCIFGDGYGRFTRTSYGDPLADGSYELSFSAEAHIVARGVKFTLPMTQGQALKVMMELVPAYMQVESNSTGIIPSAGGNLEKDITFWSFKQAGTVSVQVFVWGPSRTKENTMYFAKSMTLPLAEPGSSVTHRISIPIAGDLPNGASFCATVRTAHKDRPEDEYQSVNFCIQKGDLVICQTEPTVPVAKK